MLIFMIAVLLFGAALVAVHPEYESALLSKQQTERNFVTAVVEKAPALAPQFPVAVRIHFKTVDGADSLRDIVISGYSVDTDGNKCAPFSYVEDLGKSLPQKKACFEPIKEATDEPAWFSEVLEEIISWSE